MLGDRRERLLEEGRADRLLDLALARLKEAGLVRERSAQRTDSTHVLALVRDLTRLELVSEAVRAALEELARTAGHVQEGLVDDDWGRRYGRPVRLGKNPARPKTRTNEAGADARRLLEHLTASHPDLLRGPQVQALRQILAQNYHWDPAGRLRWRDDEGGAGLPPSAARIVSPYDLAARYARRGQVTRWTGYLAHVTETCAEDGPNVITDVATMPAASSDTLALAGIHARLDRRGLLPAGTSSTAATPPWPVWSGPGASTRVTEVQLVPGPGPPACGGRPGRQRRGREVHDPVTAQAPGDVGGQVIQQVRQPGQVIARVQHDDDVRVARLPVPGRDQPRDDIAELGGGDLGSVIGRAEPDRVQRQRPGGAVGLQRDDPGVRPARDHLCVSLPARVGVAEQPLRAGLRVRLQPVRHVAGQPDPAVVPRAQRDRVHCPPQPRDTTSPLFTAS